MQEKNFQKAKSICDTLEEYREEISKIKKMIKIRHAYIRIEYKNGTRQDNKEINIIQLGDEAIKFIVNQKLLFLQSRITELEAELRTL